jgi:Zn-finger nucleic acid-binding protein
LKRSTRKDPAEMVRCPQCELPMKPVTARGNPGSLIELDQCPQCGGIWCDKWELFPIQADEATRLEPADQELLRAPVPLITKELFCPRCTARMSPVKEPALGADVQFQRCLRCEAIWLNRGQFTHYKGHQKKLRGKRMGAEAAGKLQKLAPDTKSWVVTGTKGMFAYPAGQETIETRDDSWDSIAALVLDRLLRMVSRR